MKPGEVTATLARLSRGDAAAVDALLPVVYAEMKRLAAGYLRNERAGHTLQPTALAHEAYLKLVVQRDVTWQSRAHFLGVAAQAMRRILVDHARKRNAQRRGGGRSAIELDDALMPGVERPIEFVELDEAMQRLAQLSERQSRVVELRYIGGLTIDETAEVLGTSPITVKRDWALARAWLYRELGAGRGRDA